MEQLQIRRAWKKATSLRLVDGLYKIFSNIFGHSFHMISWYHDRQLPKPICVPKLHFSPPARWESLHFIRVTCSSFSFFPFLLSVFNCQLQISVGTAGPQLRVPRCELRRLWSGPGAGATSRRDCQRECQTECQKNAR